jgi:ABC-type phosphate/phosphonate transport system permease subunit
MPDSVVQNCNPKETTFTVKSWAVVVVILGLFGWFGIQAINHESRITRIETQYDFISKSLGTVEVVTKEIRDNQLRLQRKERD